MAPAISPDEVGGVSKAKWASVLGVIGILLGVVLPVLLYELSFSWITNPSAAPTTAASNALTLIQVFVYGFLAGWALLLLTFLIYALAFFQLNRAERRWGAAAVLTLIGFIGILATLAGAATILFSFLSYVSCIAGSTPTGCTTPVGGIVGGALLILLGFFLAFLGFIGIVIGVYRIGSKYHSGLTKVGGILYIIPVVNIIAPILALIGLSGVEKKLRAGSRGG